jgi:hypothetical protein
MNTELEKIWKVAVIVQVPFQQFPGGTEKCSETSFRLFDVPDFFSNWAPPGQKSEMITFRKFGNFMYMTRIEKMYPFF